MVLQSLLTRVVDNQLFISFLMRKCCNTLYKSVLF